MTFAAPHRPRCRPSTARLLLGAAVLLPACRACTSLDGPTRSRVVQQTRDIFDLPLNASRQMSSEAVDPNTCWIQLNLDASLPGSTLRRVLFLSPDRAFLTGTVYDTQATPPKPMLIAPAPPSGFLRTPPTPRPSPTVDAALMAYAMPAEISLRNGSASVFAQLAVGPAPSGTNLHPTAAIRVGPPICDPPGIRLVSPSAYTSRPMPAPFGAFSPRVQYKIRTAPDNATSGVVRVTVRAYAYPPLEEGGCLRIIWGSEHTVTIRVRPQ
jgi:hypothetical protein